MTYVSSGKFEQELVGLFGELKDRSEPLEEIEVPFEFSGPEGKEVAALFELCRHKEIPSIGGLYWSDFYSIPVQYDADEDEMMEDYFVEDEDQLKLFFDTVEIFSWSGNPFYTAGDAGVCCAYDDPFEISIVCDTLSDFLQYLIALSKIEKGLLPVSQLKTQFADLLEQTDHEVYVSNALEKAAEHAQDTAFEDGLENENESFDPTGLSFLFTGKLASMTRKEAQARVTELGGENAKSVTKNLDVLVIGDDGSPLYGEGTKGSKHKKADKLIEDGAGIQIVSESLFLQLGK